MNDDSNQEDWGDAQEGPDIGDVMERGIDAFQNAAAELIGAARALLDVAEDVVKDPNSSAKAMSAFGAVVEGVSRLAHGSSTRTHDRQHNDDDEDDDGDSGVRRIPVS